MAAHSITFCTPAAAKNSFLTDLKIVSNRAYPVHLPEKNEDGEFQRGLSFSDYERCHVQQRGGPRQRRCTTPLWAMNEASTRHVLLAFFEASVNSNKQRGFIHGNERERLVAVLQKMKERRAAKITVLDKLCDEFISCSDPARRKILQIEISAIDRRLQLEDHVDTSYNIVFDYYRLAMDSVGVAEKNGLTPYGVWQILFRMNKVARRLGFDGVWYPRHRADRDRRRRIENVSASNANAFALRKRRSGLNVRQGRKHRDCALAGNRRGPRCLDTAPRARRRSRLSRSIVSAAPQPDSAGIAGSSPRPDSRRAL